MTNKTIVVVSNDNDSINKIRFPLEREGFKITFTDDGEEALEFIKQINPNAIVAELNPPKIDGMDLCWAVRNQLKINHIPFIILSSSDDKEIELNSYRTGADAIIIKPISIREFMVRLEALVARYQILIPQKVSQLQVFSGELGEFLLLELIQWLHNNSKSGRLWLSHKYQRGSIYLDKGKIIQARLDNLEGEEAIYRIFSWRKGKFEFEVEEGPITSNVKKSTIEILLECSKRMDEQQHSLIFSRN